MLEVLVAQEVLVAVQLRPTPVLRVWLERQTQVAVVAGLAARQVALLLRVALAVQA
jgi:hypothetical protein